MLSPVSNLSEDGSQRAQCGIDLPHLSLHHGSSGLGGTLHARSSKALRCFAALVEEKGLCKQVLSRRRCLSVTAELLSCARASQRSPESMSLVLTQAPGARCLTCISSQKNSPAVTCAMSRMSSAIAPCAARSLHAFSSSCSRADSALLSKRCAWCRLVQDVALGDGEAACLCMSLRVHLNCSRVRSHLQLVVFVSKEHRRLPELSEPTLADHSSLLRWMLFVLACYIFATHSILRTISTCRVSGLAWLPLRMQARQKVSLVISSGHCGELC